MANDGARSGDADFYKFHAWQLCCDQRYINVDAKTCVNHDSQVDIQLEQVLAFYFERGTTSNPTEYINVLDKQYGLIHIYGIFEQDIDSYSVPYIFVDNNVSRSSGEGSRRQQRGMNSICSSDSNNSKSIKASNVSKSSLEGIGEREQDHEEMRCKQRTKELIAKGKQLHQRHGLGMGVAKGIINASMNCHDNSQFNSNSSSKTTAAIAASKQIGPLHAISIARKTKSHMNNDTRQIFVNKLLSLAKEHSSASLEMVSSGELVQQNVQSERYPTPLTNIKIAS